MTPVDLEVAYQQSDECKEVERKLTAIKDNFTADEESSKPPSKSAKYATNFFWQVRKRRKKLASFPGLLSRILLQ